MSASNHTLMALESRTDDMFLLAGRSAGLGELISVALQLLHDHEKQLKARDRRIEALREENRRLQGELRRLRASLLTGEVAA